MIPILYESTEQSFTNNGLGRLSDAITTSVNEVLNGLFLLQMTYPKTGLHYDEIQVGRIILAKPNEIDDTQPFRIFKITKGFTKITVEARHISYDLSGYPVAPFTATGIVPALTGLASNTMINSNPFTTWTNITNDTLYFNLTQVQSFRACLGGVDGSILDLSQGEYKWDRFVVKLYANRGQDNGVTIRYGKNLTDFSNARSNDEAAYTGCIAMWQNNEVSIHSAIQYTDNHLDFPTEKIFMLDATADFQEQPTVEQLNDRAQVYMTANGFGTAVKDTLTVSFVQLWQTEEYKNIAPLERVALGDIVTVLYEETNISKKVVEYTYDVIAERYTQMVLGNRRAGLAETIKQPIETQTTTEIARAVSNLENAIQQATSLISGGLGGYVVINTSADGTPNEILIMDSPDISTAVNVIRMNMNGIGFSNQGYDPDRFVTAWTIDSHFNADFITAGHIDGGLITASSIIASALEVNAYEAVTGSIENITYDGNGMHIARKDADGNIISEYQSLFTELGMRVINSNNVATLIAEGDTVEAVNLTAKNFLRVQTEVTETGTVNVYQVSDRFQGFWSVVHNAPMVAVFWEEL